MPLDATQTDFLTSLGVTKRNKKLMHIRTKEETRNDKIIGVSEDYLRREGKVLDAINELSQVDGTQHLVSELESEVSAIQRRVTGATIETAASEIEAAYKSLEVVKKRAEVLAEGAGKNSAFYLSLDTTTKALAALEQHTHKDCVAGAIETATTKLAVAREAAKKNKFTDAAQPLADAANACAAGKNTADQLAPLFQRADTAQQQMEGLRRHKQAGKIVAEIFNADAALRKFRTDATAGKVTEAGIDVTSAEAACRDGKAKADGFAEFYPKLAATTDKRDALQMQIRKDDIAAQIKTATDELKAAGEAAAKNDLVAAQAALGRADAACVLGRKLGEIALRIALEKPKLEDLKKHPQRAHIKDKTDLATTKLTEALAAVKSGDASAAEAAVQVAETANREGKDFAPKYQKVVDVRAEAGRAVAAVRNFDEGKATTKDGEIASAFQKAAPPTRNYDDAIKDLKALIEAMAKDTGKYCIPADPTPPKAPKAGSKAELEALAAKVAKITPTPADTASTGPTFDQDVAAVRALHGQVETSLAAHDLRQAMMTDSDKAGLITTTDKIADRRLKYDTARAATIGEIDKLKTHKSPGGQTLLVGQMFSLQKLAERADGLATRASMRMEDGIAELQAINATCKQLVDVADDMGAYLTERTQAENELAGLRQSGGARQIATQIGSIDKLMVAAGKMTGSIDSKTAIVKGPDMEDMLAHAQDWGDARKLLKQARAEIKTADALLAKLEDTVTVAGLVDKADDVKKVSEAEATLRKQAQTAQSADTAKVATEEYKQIFAALDEAVKQAAGKNVDAAKQRLEAAITLLVTAKTVQTEHARFETERKAIADRADVLKALTDPPAVQLKGLVDPIGTSLGEAVKQDAARNWPKTFEALRKADGEAKAAEDFRDLRKKFNADVAALELRAAGLANPLKGQVTAMIEKAKGEADKFDINYATRYLENAEAQVEGDTVAKLAKTNPDDSKFVTAIQKMLSARGGDELNIKSAYVKGGKVGATPSVGLSTKERTGEADPVKVKQQKELPGGAELLDQIVANLGTGGTPEEVAKITKAIAKIAEQRFGLDLSISVLKRVAPHKYKERELSDKGSETDTVEPTSSVFDTKRAATAKKIYEMLARMPEQAEKNPSMKKFQRKDAYKTKAGGTLEDSQASGGYYQSKGDLVVMSGRAGDSSKQKFGAALDNLAKSVFGGDTKMLPPRIDPVYEPVNEDDIDYFDFASVHEVGHAVDDRVKFMSSREGNAAFGGWKTYGGAIAPIAKAVAADVTKKNSGANARAVEQYVTDLMVGANPDVPSVEAREQEATGKACDAAKAWHTTATNESLWWNQSQTDQVTIDGIVYQEAYKGTWVSYLAAERGKAITGYQFRAPGEWFAELYAAYHMGKLKNGHPARQWLSSLSL